MLFQGYLKLTWINAQGSLQDTLPTHCLLSDSWYVSQQRVHHQAILKYWLSVLVIKPVMKVTY